MSRVMSRAQRQAAFLEEAARAFEHLEDWYDQHPEASFGELEAEARQQRRALMGRALALLINGREASQRAEPPLCPHCAQPMKLERYRRRTIYGLEGDTRLSRAYYRCPRCKGQTLFPPRPPTETACGSLE
jgi:hypothetical protein